MTTVFDTVVAPIERIKSVVLQACRIPEAKTYALSARMAARNDCLDSIGISDDIAIAVNIPNQKAISQSSAFVNRTPRESRLMDNIPPNASNMPI